MVFIQDMHKTLFKMDNINIDLESKAYAWHFDLHFIDHLLRDLGKWHWKTMSHIGDAPFFGYITKGGNLCNTSHVPLFS